MALTAHVKCEAASVATQKKKILFPARCGLYLLYLSQKDVSVFDYTKNQCNVQSDLVQWSGFELNQCSSYLR